MRIISGISVSSGSCLAPIVLVPPVEPLPSNEASASDPAAALDRIKEALQQVADELMRRSERLDGDAADMLVAGAQLALDPGLLDSAKSYLAAGQGPATALTAAIDGYAEQLTELGGYFAERVTDLRDVGDRAAALLLGRPMPGVPTLTEPSIVVATDLAPAETAMMDPAMVVGLVTSAGGRTSHTAILAAQRGIPAIVQAHGAMELALGAFAALDGDAGELILDPDEEQVQRLAKRQAAMAEVRSLRGPGVTACGQPVPLLANVGTPADAEQAAEAGAEGSGLFRTELAFLNAKVAPTRQQQTELYARVLAPFAGKPVTIRTLDAGADKPLAFADLGPEPNPALGRRGLRLCQERQDLLADQLGAIADAQAATGAVVKVMAPMVATAEETEWFVAQARTHGLEQAGVMVEIPAAALRAHDILAQCDFVSLGTNDLSQYALAADRMVGELSDLLDPWQPALLDLIAMTCDGAARLGKPVGVCGEAGGDPLAALVLVGLGVTTLSMAAAKLALVRYALSLHTLAQCRELAEAAREATSAAAARERVKQLVNPALAVLT